MRKRAVVLLSGGLDSSTVTALAQAAGFDVHALSFRYGQRHAVELEAAARVAASASVAEHKIVDLPNWLVSGSALTDNIAVPKGRDLADMATGIPVTYVPGRNQLFLAHAVSWAEVIGSRDVFIGVNALDYSGYPDCRPEFIASFQAMANLATAAAVQDGQQLKIHAPLVNMTKAQIVAEGLRLGVDYSITVSCYDATAGGACGECDACTLRLKGFAEAGAVDPSPYRQS
jgi:7-cyano-7-deazaguanine synthase